MAPRKATRVKKIAQAKKSKKAPSSPTKYSPVATTPPTPPQTPSAASSKVTKPKPKPKSKASSVSETETMPHEHEESISSSSHEAQLASVMEAYARDPNGEQGADPNIPGWITPHPPYSRPLTLSSMNHEHDHRPTRSLEYAAQFLTSPGLPRRRSSPYSGLFGSRASLAGRKRTSANPVLPHRVKLSRRTTSRNSVSSKLQQLIDQRIEAYLDANDFPPPRNASLNSSTRLPGRPMSMVATDMKRGTSCILPISAGLDNDQGTSGYQVDVWPGPGYGPPEDDGIVDPENPLGSIFSHHARSTFDNNGHAGDWNDEQMSRILQLNNDEMIPVNSSSNDRTTSAARKVLLPKDSYFLPATRSAAHDRSIFSPDHPINNPRPSTIAQPAKRLTSLVRAVSQKLADVSSQLLADGPSSKSVSFNEPLVSSLHLYPQTPFNTSHRPTRPPKPNDTSSTLSSLSSSTNIGPTIALPKLKPFTSRVPARHTNHLLSQDLYARYTAAFHTLYASAMIRESKLIKSYKAYVSSQDKLVNERHRDIRDRVARGEISESAGLAEIEAFVKRVGTKEEKLRRAIEKEIEELAEKTGAARRVVDGEIEGEDYLLEEMEMEMLLEREQKKEETLKKREREEDRKGGAAEGAKTRSKGKGEDKNKATRS